MNKKRSYNFLSWRRFTYYADGWPDVPVVAQFDPDYLLIVGLFA